ncbi:MAG: peptidylprolyl isomerase [Betaproteobacteria bacterium]|nr:peptidylprolyl isomerase [Betaproteobacteria bacterium]
MNAARFGAGVAAISVAGSHLTLHYRIALAEPPHAEVLSTYGGNPATLILGSGELAPALERCLTGVSSGTPRVFLLEPGQAFGAYREDLLQRIPASAFPAGASVEAGQVIEFSAPGGVRYAGLVKAREGAEALVDFNHPLAGRPIRFEVEILAVL